ncbi:MAG: DUF2063 domain-containing protein, partial [Paracoccaceae bacterium]
VLVLRRGFDPVPHLLPPGGGALVAALGQGETLAAAIDAGGEGFDAGAALGLMLAAGAIVEISE